MDIWKFSMKTPLITGENIIMYYQKKKAKENLNKADKYSLLIPIG